MADDFWAPVFARLLEDCEFLELIAVDTADADLISWIKPNRALFARCARFLKKNRVLDKPALVREMLTYARNDVALRKILLFNWVDKNPLTMSFPTLAAAAEHEEQLQAGAFGNPAKVRILAKIDPRVGMQPLYERVLAVSAPELESAAAPVAAASESACADAERKLSLRISDLEKVLADFKTENRQLKKQLESDHREITAQNRRIEEYSRKLKETEQKEQALASETAGLRSRLNALEKQSAQVPLPVEKVPAADNSEQLAALSEELLALRRAVENREATIRRLESEKIELAAQQTADSDKDRQITALRQRLAELEPLAPDFGQRLGGQLLSSHKDSSGRRSWLFLSLSGRAIFVESSLLSKTSLVREEFCLLHLGPDSQPAALESLEADSRREICGCLDESSAGVFLVADGQRYKVQVEIGANLIGVPVRCVWLPDFADRPAGIYRVEALARQGLVKSVQTAVGLKQILKYFKADRIDFDRFVALLRQQGTEFRVETGRVLSFAKDYHEVLEPLRMQTKVYNFCGSSDCQSRANAEVMARQVLAGQVCDFCGKCPAADLSARQRFAGQRVLIFGGDYIGSEYERVLVDYNLRVEWRSGFKNLAELKTGFGNTDLVVIIVRQISHTLLRELVAKIERDSLPVLYSSRRGVSGVLAELTAYLGVSGD